MFRESRRRPWADLCPELLNLIYEKLPPVAAFRISGFGSVCKPWRQLHRSIPLPPPPPDHHPYRPGPGHLLVCPTIDAATPDKIRDELQTASIAYSWPNSGWLLLRRSCNGQIFSCFNPLLPWPRNYIKLPSRPAAIPVLPPAPRINAAFSSDPTGPRDWTILVVEERFSTYRRGDSAWKNHHLCNYTRLGYRCVAIGFREGKFLCLFERGDVLILGLRGREWRMLAANHLAPVPAPPGQQYNELRIVERGRKEGGTCVVVNWELAAEGHGGGGGGGGRWRLAGVERRRKEEGDGGMDLPEESMEEGRRLNSRVVLVTQSANCTSTTGAWDKLMNVVLISLFFAGMFITIGLPILFLGTEEETGSDTYGQGAY
ncbi:unnamed protein product [Linum trigynum]|uniref:KIB1-4 beta-propeller domain-containing protein n=1 Tax=Linum trigynum TaxID=586398 RepID=A0AAV2DI84_9ROSI